MNGPEIKAARERLGLSQLELGRLIGTGLFWVSRLEAGSRPVPWYLPLVLELLEGNPELVPGLLADGVENKIGAPAWFATLMTVAARSNTRAMTVDRIAEELFGPVPEPVEV